MTTLSAQWLPRLPLCTRQEITSRAWRRPYTLIQCRPSPSHTGLRMSRHYAQSSRPAAARRKQPSKPTLPRPQASHPPPKESRPPPRPSTYLSGNTGNTYASQLLGSSSQVLLYHAPPHRGFTITSIITGAIIILGSVNFFSFALAGRRDEDTGKPAPIPWHVKALTLVPSVAMAVMGTTFLIAPARLVRAITLVSRKQTVNAGSAGPEASSAFSSSSSSSPVLRFHTRPGFPYLFRRGRTFEVDPGHVKLDLQVRATNPPNMKSFSINEAEQFTTDTIEKGLAKKRGGLVERLLNAGPALVHDVRRMFLRDSIAYMEIKDHGLWKLDLHRALVLDEAKPLRRLVQMDANMDRSIFGKVRALIS